MKEATNLMQMVDICIYGTKLKSHYLRGSTKIFVVKHTTINAIKKPCCFHLHFKLHFTTKNHLSCGHKKSYCSSWFGSCVICSNIPEWVHQSAGWCPGDETWASDRGPGTTGRGEPGGISDTAWSASADGPSDPWRK